MKLFGPFRPTGAIGGSFINPEKVVGINCNEIKGTQSGISYLIFENVLVLIRKLISNQFQSGTNSGATNALETTNLNVSCDS